MDTQVPIPAQSLTGDSCSVANQGVGPAMLPPSRQPFGRPSCRRRRFDRHVPWRGDLRGIQDDPTTPFGTRDRAQPFPLSESTYSNDPDGASAHHPAEVTVRWWHYVGSGVRSAGNRRTHHHRGRPGTQRLIEVNAWIARFALSRLTGDARWSEARCEPEARKSCMPSNVPPRYRRAYPSTLPI